MKKRLMFFIYLATYLLCCTTRGQSKSDYIEADSLEESIKAIKYEQFYGQPIDSLFAAYPILSQYTDYFFFTEPANCLQGMGLKFLFRKSILVVDMYPKKLEYLEPCKKGRIEWDLNLFRKEKLKEVIVW